MDVDHPVLKFRGHFIKEKEASKHDKLNAVFFQCLGDAVAERAVTFKISRIENRGRGASILSSNKAVRVLLAADDKGDFRIQTAGLDPLVQVFKSAAGAGKQDSELEGHREKESGNQENG